MPDAGHEETDALLARMERKVEKVYRKAATETRNKLNEYLKQYKADDEKKRAAVKSGDLSEEAYQKWRKDHMIKGKQYQDMLDVLADDYVNADKIAMSIVNEHTPEAYAINRNYAAFEIEKGLQIDTSFTLYDRQTVERLIREKEILLPKPRVDIPKDRRWNRQHIRDQITQGVLQGDSIPNIAKRLQKVAQMDKAAAIRNARTAVTGAENAGRVDGYKRAQEMGIDLQQEWLASLDMKTRHSHRQMDGVRVNVGQKFPNGLRYPGDPEGPPEEVYNCRCTLVAALTGFDASGAPRKSRLGGMSYEEWKNEKQQEFQKTSENVHAEAVGFLDAPQYLKKLGYSDEEANLMSQVIHAYIQNPDRVAEYTEKINKLIEDMPDWKGRVYRGLPTSKDYKVGDTINERKISSWTSRKSVAREYSGSAEFMSDNAWELRPGQKSVIFVCDDVGGASISRFHDPRFMGVQGGKYVEEVITPSYNKYEVVKVEHSIESGGREVEYVYLKRRKR